MKMKLAFSIGVLAAVVAIAGARTSNAQTALTTAQAVQQAPPVSTYPAIPVVTGPTYAVPAQSTPPTSTSSAPAYQPTYESTAPVYAIPPENTPPPTTPGENP